MEPNATPSHPRGPASRSWQSPAVRHRITDGWRARAETGRGRAGRITVHDLVGPPAATRSEVAWARATFDDSPAGDRLDAVTVEATAFEVLQHVVGRGAGLEVHAAKEPAIESAVIPPDSPKSVAIHVGAGILTLVPDLDASGNLRIVVRRRRTVTLAWVTGEIAIVDAERILGSITRRLAQRPTGA